ncbi:hypothetical protein ONZ45_g6999 [Pleurotus djamor]|nr:hypothetical protein ONZ45_g6999 [Pleurotus djamor]
MNTTCCRLYNGTSASPIAFEKMSAYQGDVISSQLAKPSVFSPFVPSYYDLGVRMCDQKDSTALEVELVDKVTPDDGVIGEDEGARCIIVMGVSGTGKSTLGSAIAKALDMPFIDGDDLHPASNVAKMSAGQPLTDEDREPWLELIRTTAKGVCSSQVQKKKAKTEGPLGELCGLGVVIVCSSLKRYYRDILRGKSKPATDTNRIPEHLEPPHAEELPTYFVFIKGDRELLLERMMNRKGHFMKANMLDSQLQTLEDPEGEEGVIVVSARDSTEEQVAKAKEALKL